MLMTLGDAGSIPTALHRVAVANMSS